MYHIGCATSLWTITLFDTCAHASFVNCEIAAWIGKQFVPAKQLGARNRGRQEDQNTSVALAATSLSSLILESVAFIFSLTRSQALSPSWASRWYQWQHQWLRERGVAKRSPEIHRSTIADSQFFKNLIFIKWIFYHNDGPLSFF